MNLSPFSLLSRLQVHITLCWLRDLDLWPTNRASSRYVVPVTSLLSCLKTPVHHTAHFFVLALLGCDVDRWPDTESYVISLFIRPDGTRMQADSERPTLWSWNRTLYSIIRAPRFIYKFEVSDVVAHFCTWPWPFDLRSSLRVTRYTGNIPYIILGLVGGLA